MTEYANQGHLLRGFYAGCGLTVAGTVMNPIQPVNPKTAGLLVGIPGLLDALFGDKCNQPSKRWIQYQMARRNIPYIKISGLSFFDPVMVRAALEKNCLISAATGKASKSRKTSAGLEKVVTNVDGGKGKSKDSQ